MHAEPNPEIVTLARLARGESQAALAKKLGVSPGTLSRIEHGVTPLDDERVTMLAEKLRYPRSLFYRSERVRGTDSFCFHHRKRKTMPVRLLDSIESEMHLAQLQVKRLLGGLDIQVPLEFPTIDPAEYGGPQEVARLVRAMWRVPTGPISHMVRLVESTGAVVVMRDFGTQKLDAMSCWAKGVPPLFFLNSTMPTDRLRWSIAHEVGHLVMHWTAPEGDPEAEADAFARELLLPEDESKNDLRQLTFKRLPQLKAYWRVSMLALVRSASARGALPPNKIKSLYVQMSRLGWRTDEPFPLSSELPTLTDDAIAVHLREHGYSIEELASVLDLEADEFRTTWNVGQPQQQRLHLA